MRLLEVLLSVLLASAAVSLLISRLPKAGRLFLAGALIVAVLHANFEGAHWQMIPAYAALGILCLIAWRPGGRRSLLQATMVASALLFVGASILLSFLLPMFRLPRPTGPYAVGTTILYFKDSSRIEDAAPSGGSPRELMVQLWYPAQPSHNRFARYREPRETHLISSYQSVLPTNSRLDAPLAAASSPFPVILFNHSWAGRRTNYTYLTEELASQGYIVASIDHTYNAGLVAFPDGRVIRGTSADLDGVGETTGHVRAIWDKELLKSAADEQFILDQLEIMNHSAGTSWYGHLNTNLVGAIGHSFGGSAATQVCAIDHRVRASVNMDGWFFGAIQARGPNQPLLVVDSSSDREEATASKPRERVGDILNAADFADTEGSLRRFGGYQLFVRGAEHDDYTDQPLVSPLRSLSHRGALPASRIEAIVRTYVVAFFDKTLRGADPAILGAHSSPFEEVSFEAWPNSKSEIASSSGHTRMQ
jgi:dienelactone hydrolase